MRTADENSLDKGRRYFSEHWMKVVGSTGLVFCTLTLMDAAQGPTLSGAAFANIVFFLVGGAIGVFHAFATYDSVLRFPDKFAQLYDQQKLGMKHPFSLVADYVVHPVKNLGMYPLRLHVASWVYLAAYVVFIILGPTKPGSHPIFAPAAGFYCFYWATWKTWIDSKF